MKTWGEKMKIGERGQVTIPKQLRGKYGLMPHMDVEFTADKNGVLICKKTSRSPVDDVYGIFNQKADTDSYLEEIRGR